MNDDDIDNMIKKYIYESPDGGKTVTKREFGSDEKELIKLADEYEEITGNSYDMSRDWLDLNKTYTIDTSTLTSSGTTITTSASPDYQHLFDNAGSIDLSSVYTDVEQDITLSVDGEERKISDLFKTVDVIKKRMAILEPKKEMLEKYTVLQDLYDQYKAAEALLDGPDVEDDNENN